MLAGRKQKSRTELLIERRVTTGGDGHHGSKICRGRCTLKGQRACPDHVADEVVVLRQNERAELVAGLLVKDTTISVLHLQHPPEIPQDLLKKIRQISMLFRDVQVQVAKRFRIKLPGPQQGAAGDTGVDDIPAIVARIMPAAMVGQGTVLPGAFTVGPIAVAGRVAVAIAKVHRASAALARVPAHRHPQCRSIHAIFHEKGTGSLPAALDPVAAACAQAGKVRYLNAIARGRIGWGCAERAFMDHEVVRCPTNTKGALAGSRAPYRGDLAVPGAVADLVEKGVRPFSGWESLCLSSEPKRLGRQPGSGGKAQRGQESAAVHAP